MSRFFTEHTLNIIYVTFGLEQNDFQHIAENSFCNLSL